jgi:predicted O-linked N-acetylglucosamine transferase (SPINDLY family)
MQAVDCALPIVTRDGQFMRGRFASGILKIMGLSDLVANSDDEYINFAVRLSQDVEYRNEVINKMNEKNHILYDDLEPVRAFEEFLLIKYRDMSEP